MSDSVLDCTKMCCPVPIVRVSQRMRELESGQILTVEATDPAFHADLEAWTCATGHQLLEFHEGDVQRAVLRKT